MRDLFEDLFAIHQKGEMPTEGKGVIIYRKDGAYLSGSPYTWTSFAERAFIFRDSQQAREILEKHGLKGTIHIRPC